VRLASDGRFVVAWQSDAQDGANAGVFARRFSAAGVAQGAEIPVNVVTANNQQRPALEVDNDGDFTVAWDSYGQDGQFGGIFARHWSSSGAAVGGEFQVNTYITNVQTFPAVASGGGAAFVVAWQSLGQDSSGEGVFAQRFGSGTAILDIDGNGALTALTDGILVLRYLFGLTGTALTGSAVGAGCTRCDPVSIKGYLDTLI
jgi:hypothetical protein